MNRLVQHDSIHVVWSRKSVVWFRLSDAYGETV